MGLCITGGTGCFPSSHDTMASSGPLWTVHAPLRDIPHSARLVPSLPATVLTALSDSLSDHWRRYFRAPLPQSSSTAADLVNRKHRNLTDLTVSRSCYQQCKYGFFTCFCSGTLKPIRWKTAKAWSLKVFLSFCRSAAALSA
jgi:hypothetical protein